MTCLPRRMPNQTGHSARGAFRVASRSCSATRVAVPVCGPERIRYGRGRLAGKHGIQLMASECGQLVRLYLLSSRFVLLVTESTSAGLSSPVPSGVLL